MLIISKQDWISGVKVGAPDKRLDPYGNTEVIKDSERLRLVYLILTAPEAQGGAAITPNLGLWTDIEAIFPLHNKTFNDAWIRRWSQKWFIDDGELIHLCDHFGTDVAM